MAGIGIGYRLRLAGHLDLIQAASGLLPLLGVGDRAGQGLGAVRVGARYRPDQVVQGARLRPRPQVAFADRRVSLSAWSARFARSG